MYADNTTIYFPTSPNQEKHAIEEFLKLATDICSTLNFLINNSRTTNLNFTTANLKLKNKNTTDINSNNNQMFWHESQ